jgi:hypothetical protein
MARSGDPGVAGNGRHPAKRPQLFQTGLQIYPEAHGQIKPQEMLLGRWAIPQGPGSRISSKYLKISQNRRWF